MTSHGVRFPCYWKARARLALAAFVLALAGCASSPAAAFEGDGVHVRHVRVRVAPSHTQAFEALVERCVQSARAAGLPRGYHWLFYREPPGRYWLLWFSESADGFAVPEEPDPLVGFARHVADAEGEAARAEIERRLSAIEYEVEWTVLMRQKATWGTVGEMSTSTHPKARMMLREVRSGAEEAFDGAVAARTALLQDHGYPLPVEGFAIVSGMPGHALQVVFPVDWPSFHATDSFGAFVRGLDEAAQEEYARRKGMLMETMASAEYYDGSVVRELSYGAD